MSCQPLYFAPRKMAPYQIRGVQAITHVTVSNPAWIGGVPGADYTTIQAALGTSNTNERVIDVIGNPVLTDTVYFPTATNPNNGQTLNIPGYVTMAAGVSTRPFFRLSSSNITLNVGHIDGEGVAHTALAAVVGQNCTFTVDIISNCGKAIDLSTVTGPGPGTPPAYRGFCNNRFFITTISTCTWGVYGRALESSTAIQGNMFDIVDITSSGSGAITLYDNQGAINDVRFFGHPFDGCYFNVGLGPLYATDLCVEHIAPLEAITIIAFINVYTTNLTNYTQVNLGYRDGGFLTFIDKVITLGLNYAAANLTTIAAINSAGSPLSSGQGVTLASIRYNIKVTGSIQLTGTNQYLYVYRVSGSTIPAYGAAVTGGAVHFCGALIPTGTTYPINFVDTSVPQGQWSYYIAMQGTDASFFGSGYNASSLMAEVI